MNSTVPTSNRQSGFPVQQLINEEVKAEQVRQIFRSSISATGISLLNALILAVVQWQVIDHGVILGWLGLGLVISLYRIRITRKNLTAFEQGITVKPKHQRELTLTIALFSLFWFLSVLLLFPANELIHQFFLAFIIAGMTAGATTAIGISRGLLQLYLLPVSTLLTLRLLLEGNLITTAMALLTPIYIVTLLIFAGRLRKRLIENVGLRIQSEHNAHELRLGDTAFESNEAMAITDAQGRIIRSNRAFTELTGYGPQELQGREISLLNPPSYNEAHYEHIWEQVRNEGRWEGELLNHDKGGMPFTTRSIITAMRSPEGGISNYIASYTNISELKAQHELLSLSSQMEKLLGQLLQLSLQNTSLKAYLNEVLATVLQTVPWLKIETRGAVFLRSQEQDDQLALVAELNLSPQLRSLCQQVPFGHCLCGRVAQERTPLFAGQLDERHDVRFEGIEEHGHYVLPLMQNEELLGVLTLYVEHRHQHSTMEMAFLTRIAHIFSLGITRRYSDMRMAEAREVAEKASQAKSEFLSSMSHELRTPLNAVMGFAQLLEMEIEDPAQLDQLREINLASQHLLELINEILDLAKIEAGKMELNISDVPIKNVVDECIGLTQSMAQQRRIDPLNHINDPTLTLRADQVRLKQVLLNLLSNGIKYNKDSGGLRVDIEPRDNGRVRLRVADTGMGLSKEQCGQLFQPFERLGQQHRAVEGTGIGLVITRRLVELMNGSIGVESESGVGSTFWVELPVGDRAAGKRAADLAMREQPTPQLAANTKLATILYIEDNPVNIKLVQKLIEKRSGIRLITAMDPGTGLFLASEHKPDLILLDINLPDMDGYEVLKRLRDTPLTADTAVIGLSANALPSDIERAMAAGFTDYMTKPIRINRFFPTLERWLPGSGA